MDSLVVFAHQNQARDTFTEKWLSSAFLHYSNSFDFNSLKANWQQEASEEVLATIEPTCFFIFAENNDSAISNCFEVPISKAEDSLPSGLSVIERENLLFQINYVYNEFLSVESYCRLVLGFSLDSEKKYRYRSVIYDDTNLHPIDFSQLLAESTKVVSMSIDIFEVLSSADCLKDFFRFSIEQSGAKKAGCKSFDDLINYVKSKIEAEKAKKIKIERKQLEADFEYQVLTFLQLRGLKVAQQQTVGKHRLDLLLANELILELKAGKVTGDDVCQAADYLQTHGLDVLLVGTGLSDAATRGIEAINHLSKKNQIFFVTKNACLRYLEATVCKH